MILEAECKVCGAKVMFDIGNYTKEEAISKLKKFKSFECPGHHFENGSPVDFVKFGKVVDGAAPTEAEWLKDLKKKYDNVYSTDDLTKKFNVEGFSGGMCVAKRKSDGKTVYLDFSTSPKGVRYYH